METLFELQPDDEYDKFCGKVFLTTKKNVIFHCMLCESKYLGFENYMNHLKENHFSDQTDALECDELDDDDDDDELPLEEDEFPITTLQKKTNINVLQSEKDTNPTSTAVATTSVAAGEAILESQGTINTSTIEVNIVEEEERAIRIEDRSRRTPVTPSAKGIFECPHCPLRFLLQFTLREHLKDHDLDRVHKCSICGVQFKKRGALKSHLRRHEVEKQYKCTECNRSFINPSELRYHERKHTGEKPYQCESCGIKYAYKSNLRLHRKRHHTHQRDYPCPLCNKSYFTPRHLRDHMSRHTNEPNYKCEKCGKAFKTSSNFQRHKAQHRMQEEAEKNKSNDTIDSTAVDSTLISTF